MENRKNFGKRLVCAASALCLMVAFTSTAFAVESTGTVLDTKTKTGTMEITTRKDASYTIIIPKTANITFDTVSNPIGSIVYQDGNLEPDAYVTVALKGKTDLKYTVNEKYTIPYKICGTDKTKDFVSVKYEENTEKNTRTPLTAEITKEAWEEAKAGSYKATLTFEISYTNPHEAK